MKLADHVDHIRQISEGAFDKHFARLGLGKNKRTDIEKLPETIRQDRLYYEEMLKSHINETGGYEKAREKLIDEFTFTLFNRLAAIKVMEAALLFPPILTKQTEHGGRSFGHKAWLEVNPHQRDEELEGIKDYIQYAFDTLAETLPLYHKNYPYGLLPDPISLNDIIDAFNKVQSDIHGNTDIWLNDDILGWMYESYNNAKKKAHKESGDKTEYNKVSLQSQVYTPEWVVKFLVDNALGKLYLESYPDSDIKNHYKIANAPTERQQDPKPLTEIKAIDPACGSGNFLLYAFDLFYALYQDQIDNYDADYDPKDIPRLIIENNLYGIDLDDRAVQLAQLGLYIKALKKNNHIKDLDFKVVSSDFYLPTYATVDHIFSENGKLDPHQRAIIAEIWSDLSFAYKFGSLIQIESKIKQKLHHLIEQDQREQQSHFSATEMGEKKQAVQMNLLTSSDITKERDFIKQLVQNLQKAVSEYATNGKNPFLSAKTKDAITFLEIMMQNYDIAMANPPYTDSSDFGPDLKQFIENHYKKPYKFHINLYATFILRCFDLTHQNGKIAMIHPHTFMFIKTFEDVRKFMIDKCHVDVMVDFGLDRVNLFGPGVLLDATFYVLSKNKSNNAGIYFNLTNNLQEKFKKETFLEAVNDQISNKRNDRVYTLPQDKLKIIKSCPFIYWISDDFREKFMLDPVDSALAVRRGCKTCNNNRFLKFWWEISLHNIYDNNNKDACYYPYSKGGPYNKWFGNSWLTVDFRPKSKAHINEYGNLTSSEFYGKNGTSYSASGSKGPSFRLLPEHSVFDVGGSSIFAKKYNNVLFHLGYLNSKLTSYLIKCLNPTVNTQIFDIKRLPFVIPPKKQEEIVTDLAKKCCDIKQKLCEYSVIEPTFKQSPYQGNGSLKKYLNMENHYLTQVLINEAIINETIFDIYDLTDHDKAMVLAKEGQSIGGLAVCSDARMAYLYEASDDFPLDDVTDFIHSLPSQEFDEDYKQNIIKGFDTLYQSNNDLEKFCIKHQINPINVWYWFKNSTTLPKQRVQTLAMEFLVDMVRDILNDDDDGIIPLVPNAGEKVLIDRIEAKFYEKGFSQAQFSRFDKDLGRPLSEYLNKSFFVALSDHLNLFMYLPKTPFIWHLSSGPEQGFDCFILIYKWSRDKLMRIRSVYIEHRERALVNRQADLLNNQSADAQNEKDRIFKQLKEIEDFKNKIDDLLEDGYTPVLDDGVGKNIAPLQKCKMIPYDVLNAGQLKKYLNADW